MNWNYRGAAWISAALVMLVACGWLFVARVQAQAPAPFEIRGQVLNGTRDAARDSIANLPVTLFQITERGPVTVTVAADANGAFRFTNVITNATSYFARIDYAGVRYFSDIMPRALAASMPISLTVYETQTMPADFRLDRVHLIMDVQPKALTALQFLQVNNPTDRAFYIPLPMPDNASAPRFDNFTEQTRLETQPDGSVWYPVLPTTTDILYSLTIPYTPPNFTLSMPLRNGVDGINLLVSKLGDVAVAGSNLTPGNPFTAQNGQTYLLYAAPPQQAGTTFTANLSNLPGADNTQNLQTLILVAGGLGGLALLAYPVYRRRAANQKANEAYDRATLVQAMARLDDAYARDEIDESDYQTQRAALKAELLKDRLSGIGGQ
jgi:hypothetical protein